MCLLSDERFVCNAHFFGMVLCQPSHWLVHSVVLDWLRGGGGGGG